MAAGEAENKATRRTNDVGPTGQTVAQNIARLRTLKGLSTYRLSELLAEVDRPIAPSAISRIESGSRKVDVDDLIAFASVLKVSPTALLLPPTIEGEVEITAIGSTPAAAAWGWLLGEQPLAEDLPANDDGEAWNNFQTYSRPAGRRNYYGDRIDAVMGADGQMVLYEAKRFTRDRTEMDPVDPLAKLIEQASEDERFDTSEGAGAPETPLPKPGLSRAEYRRLMRTLETFSKSRPTDE